MSKCTLIGKLFIHLPAESPSAEIGVEFDTGGGIITDLLFKNPT